MTGAPTASPDPAAALSRVARAERERVRRFGRRVCRDGADADDAVQDAFVRLARRPDVVASGGALPWLLAVVRTACLRLLAPRARQRALAELDALAPGRAAFAGPATPEAELSRAEEVRAVQAALAALDPGHREVLLLRDIEGRSGEETARALGIGLVAMKARLHRARRALGERLRGIHAPSTLPSR